MKIPPGTGAARRPPRFRGDRLGLRWIAADQQRRQVVQGNPKRASRPPPKKVTPNPTNPWSVPSSSVTNSSVWGVGGWSKTSGLSAGVLTTLVVTLLIFTCRPFPKAAVSNLMARSAATTLQERTALSTGLKMQRCPSAT